MQIIFSINSNVLWSKRTEFILSATAMSVRNGFSFFDAWSEK